MNIPHSRTGQYTSSLAGADMHASGAAATQRAEVVRAVRLQPGLTGGELAEVTGLTRHQVGRRTSDAELLGEIVKGAPRKCRASGRLCATWLPREGQAQLW